VHSHESHAEDLVATAAAAKNPSQPARLAAVKALANTRTDEGLNALMDAAMTDKDDIVRIFATDSLTHIDCDAARDYLCDAHLKRLPMREIVPECSQTAGVDVD